ncbi:MAG TPA: RidA family protein [Burkholderiales bacterium]|nr:RidA family protein [Burkholderiales bacterium]
MKRATTARRIRPAAKSSRPRFRVRFSSPPGLYDPKAFSHVVEVEGARLVFISGQVPVDAERRLTSRELRAQLERIYDNLELALRSAGAGFEHVVKTTNYLTDVGQAGVFREVRDRRFARLERRPASTTVVVKGLVDPEYLAEIEVIAAVPAAG